MIASTSFTFDPVWPWSTSWLGLPGLLTVVVILVALTILTYLLVQPRRYDRLLIVLALRLGALLVACLLVLRPSLAQLDDSVIPSKLLILLDASQSMNITDELNGQSRWDRARAILNTPSVATLLKRLQDEQKVEIVWYHAAEDLGPYKPESSADGKRTDMGRWLNALWKLHAEDKNLRGLLLLTDGADNGTTFATLEEAARWRSAACPVQPFALGSPTTTPKQRDIAIDPERFKVTPTPVRVNNELKARAVVNAPGFENVRVRLRLLIDGKEIAGKDVTLEKSVGNEVELSGPAPDKAGEVKVTLRVDPIVGEVTTLNNEVSTYATVTKDGVNVLWVEGKRPAFESVFAIRHVLSRDPRFKIVYTERLKDSKPAPAGDDLFNFKKRHYDVIVIGDIAADLFAGGHPEVFQQIHDMVEKKRTGLFMLGGYNTFASGGWQGKRDIAGMLPVELNESGRIDGKVYIRRPESAAFSDYVIGPPSNVAMQENVWQALPALEGLAKLGKVKDGATLYLKSDDEKAVLVGTKAGEGRVLVYAGDTAFQAWRRTAESIKLYEQFWRQTLLWCAQQEKAGGNVWIEPDTRRLAAGNKAGFTLKIRGKTGKEVDRGTVRFTAKVIGPQKDVTEVAVVEERGEFRGMFWKTGAPGEYTIKASGSGKDPADGSMVNGDPEVKFMVYAEDLETLRPAADHDFLAKVAAAGGGKLRLGGESEMEKFLQELLTQPVAQSKPKAELWPDWRRDPASTTVLDQVRSLWHSGLLVCFVLFAAFLCVEWYLRRRWGMV